MFSFILVFKLFTNIHKTAVNIVIIELLPLIIKYKKKSRKALY